MAAISVERLTALLRDDDAERRVAAAIVIGALRVKGAAVAAALAEAVREGGPKLQRHALEALTPLAAKKALSAILGAVQSVDRGVREAAVTALVAYGEGALKPVQARLAEAGADERRALEAVLAQLGGKGAFEALLESLADADAEQASAAAVRMRGQVKGADKRARKTRIDQLARFLERQAKRADGGAGARAALKMLGYLEDERAVPILLAHTKPKNDPALRQEAFIALRFCGASADAKLINALVAAAADDDRALSQTALMTLATLPLNASAVKKLTGLLDHADLDRVQFVMDMLGGQRGTVVAERLVALLESPEQRRAGLAAAALAKRDDAGPALAAALLASEDPRRADALARALRGHASGLDRKVVTRLRARALERLTEGALGYEALLDIAGRADPDATAEALRALAKKLAPRKPERACDVLRLLVNTSRGSDADRFLLASLLLRASRKHTGAKSRADDEALIVLDRLLSGGYDVAGALRKDRRAGLEELFYVGFHLIERGHPSGAELLEHVVGKAGRKKIGRAARNKLKLSG